MIREIVVEGDPILRKSMPFVKYGESELNRVVRDLWDTLTFMGAAGLAATQIGEPFNVCVVRRKSMVLVNPSIVHGKRPIPSIEGCFSIPGYKAFVPRFRFIKLVSRKPAEQVSTLQVIDDVDLARTIQHEIDHLNGILIRDYVQQDHSRKGGVLIHTYDPDYETAVAYKKQLDSKKNKVD